MWILPHYGHPKMAGVCSPIHVPPICPPSPRKNKVSSHIYFSPVLGSQEGRDYVAILVFPWCGHPGKVGVM